MFDADSTDEDFGDLSPTEIDAARGALPAWARASPARREHMERVARLLEEWAHALGYPPYEALRWSAAGWLHDVLRDADPAELRKVVPAEDRDLPDQLLHGPAAAVRLRHDVSAPVASAIRYHTVGHPALGDLGRALYLADFLEPGREFRPEWRDELRRRMPGDRARVLVEVLAARLTHMIEERRPIRSSTAEFWASALANVS